MMSFFSSTSARRLFVATAGACALVAHAAEPIIQTNFTADPAPLVHDGVVYLYTSHDEDDAPPGQGRFRMLDWKCYSSTDLVNWTDHGTIASLATFPWAVQSNDAWAPQVVERAGKFYLYVPISVDGWPKNVIAVAMADNPLGPFKDALGRPLIDKAEGYIDPTVFVDDDGQAYLYFGNPHLWYVKLNDDMISLAGPIVQEPTKPENYQEGPWFYKRAGHYYLAYASTCCPEGIGYAMSDRPTGPWTYRGYIMRPDRRSTGNHPGIVDYKGGSYVFGFNFKLNFAVTAQHHERRSVCVAKLDYNPDGTVRELPWWEEAPSVAQLGTLDPYRRVEGETICWSEGIKTAAHGRDGLCVYPTRERAYLKVQGVDLAGGAKSFRAAVAAATSGAQIEIRLDQASGPLVGRCAIPDTGGGAKWATVACPLAGAAGVHDVFLVFTGVAAASPRLDWWQVE
ncbi:MAG TPA: glycoside hydrolase family 43 protein [Opitutaceae bacterium]|nr:glycoside hydrolase family 43 protein [Opitutaceae bacterium]